MKKIVNVYNGNIETNVVPGANAVVTRNILNTARAVGMPAKVINSQGVKVSDTNLRKNSCY